jgi:hypothetical protein
MLLKDKKGVNDLMHVLLKQIRCRRLLISTTYYCYKIIVTIYLEAKYKTGLRFRIIRVCLEASISVTCYNELFFTSKHKEHFFSSSQVI